MQNYVWSCSWIKKTKSIFVLQFYKVYIIFLGFSLMGVWILNIALYASVKRRPRLTENCCTNSTNVPTTLSDDNLEGPASAYGRKSRTSWVSLTALIGKRFSSANAMESSFVSAETSHEHFQRKHLELSLAKTVWYVVIAFTLALVPGILATGTSGLSSLDRTDSSNFSPVVSAAWNGSAYLAARILFSNSFVNCIIYSYRNKNFRTGLKKLFVRFDKK